MDEDPGCNGCGGLTNLLCAYSEMIEFIPNFNKCFVIGANSFNDLNQVITCIQQTELTYLSEIGDMSGTINYSEQMDDEFIDKYEKYINWSSFLKNCKKDDIEIYLKKYIDNTYEFTKNRDRSSEDIDVKLIENLTYKYDMEFVQYIKVIIKHLRDTDMK
jgi:vacuolar-type H+-ATPase subunit I/STV1